jgi:hypothetical protein
MAGTPHKIVNGQTEWTGKTKTAAEAERDKHLNRLFADLNWEPIVIPFPQGVMIGFVKHQQRPATSKQWLTGRPALNRQHHKT